MRRIVITLSKVFSSIEVDYLYTDGFIYTPKWSDYQNGIYDKYSYFILDAPFLTDNIKFRIGIQEDVHWVVKDSNETY